MSVLTRLHALCLALTISQLVGCTDFQAQSRAGSAKEYNELGLWINNTKELANLHKPPKPDDR